MEKNDQEKETYEKTIENDLSKLEILAEETGDQLIGINKEKKDEAIKLGHQIVKSWGMVISSELKEDFFYTIDFLRSAHHEMMFHSKIGNYEKVPLVEMIQAMQKIPEDLQKDFLTIMRISGWRHFGDVSDASILIPQLLQDLSPQARKDFLAIVTKGLEDYEITATKDYLNTLAQNPSQEGLEKFVDLHCSKYGKTHAELKQQSLKEKEQMSNTFENFKRNHEIFS